MRRLMEWLVRRAMARMMTKHPEGVVPKVNRTKAERVYLDPMDDDE